VHRKSPPKAESGESPGKRLCGRSAHLKQQVKSQGRGQEEQKENKTPRAVVCRKAMGTVWDEVLAAGDASCKPMELSS